jgi:hypothetical protein
MRRDTEEQPPHDAGDGTGADIAQYETNRPIVSPNPAALSHRRGRIVTALSQNRGTMA